MLSSNRLTGMGLRRPWPLTGVAWLSLVLVASGCAGPDSGADGSDQIQVVATTSIWADIVNNVTCGDAGTTVEALIPIGADPHGVEPSLADRARLESAGLIVANGLLLEEGLEDVLSAVETDGTPIVRMADHIETLALFGPSDDTGEADDHDVDGGQAEADDDHADDADDGNADDDHADADADADADDDDDDDDGHGGDDPHIWLDPQRVWAGLPALLDPLVETGFDREAVDSCLHDYQRELVMLDAEIEEMLAAIPPDARKLVTNHDSLGYFADRYGFEVVGTVIPGPSTLAESNPRQLQELATTIEQNQVAAIFTEAQYSGDEAATLAARVGEVELVTLFTGSLGEQGSGAETYIDLLRTNAQLIADALS